MIEWILVILLFLMVIGSTQFFLVQMKATIKEWLIFNACAPSIFLWILGVFIEKIFHLRFLMHSAIIPLTFFGTQGLFIFPWKGMDIIPQISHIFMTLASILTVFQTFVLNDFKQATIGFLFGLLTFPFISIQQNYCARNPEKLKKMLGLSFGEEKKEK
ncbi:hypothetical protein M0811_11436 [Anaeramoeba ignava]|uniref:Uncharacterized protein n=1 Tax=Anaeramoeba ignava TaxID=1746090 RepID=A0A9Q0R7E0_ANAIG|nr:hypothetical protein M0811_11436 [Anaeramoeba ignava]